MMEEMMKECCGLEGKPDFEMMKKFMEKCGKTQFGEEEIRMMKECCVRRNAGCREDEGADGKMRMSRP